MSEELKGKNLFEYNGIIYTDNIPKNMFLSITKEQYVEYMQQKEKIEKQQEEIEELKKDKKALVDNYNKVLGSFISKDKIRAKIKDITEYYEKEVRPEMYHWGDFTAEEHFADIIARYNELLEE